MAELTKIQYIRAITRGLQTLDLIEQAKQGVAITAFANGVIALSGGLGGILAARLLGPEGRGELAAAVVWAGVLTVVVSLGIPQALTFFVARDAKAIGTIFRVTLFVWTMQSIASFVLGCGMLGILEKLQPKATEVVRIYLFSIPFSMLITYLSTMAQGLRKFALFNILRMAASVAYLLGVVLAIFLKSGSALEVVRLLLLFQVATACLCLIVFVFCVKPKGNFEPARISPMLRYGINSYWGSLAWMANGRLDQFIMSMFVSLESLGYYAVAVSYATFLFPLAGIFAMVLFPNVAAAPSIEEAKEKINSAFKSTLLTLGMGALVFGGVAPWLLPGLFGAPFSISIVPAIILLFGTILLGCNYVLSDGLRGMGYPLDPSYAELIGMIFTVVGLLVLLPSLGIMGAAFTSVASYALVFSILLIRFKAQQQSKFYVGSSK